MSLASKVKAAAANVKASVKQASTAVKTGASNAAAKVSVAAQNAGSGVKQAAQKVASTAAAAANSVKNAAIKVASLTVFIPMIPVAKIFLKKNNIVPASKNDEILLQVYNLMNKKNFGYASEPDSFDIVHAAYQNGSGGVESFGLIPITPEMILMVVQFLKSVFDTIKAKKAAKQALTPDEQAVMDKAPEIESALADAQASAAATLAAADEKAKKIEQDGADSALNILGGGMTTGKILLIIALVLLILFFVFKGRK